MDFDSKTFSYRLTALMEEIDISQVELGKRIGISNVTISRYINGERIPRLDIIIKLANVFNVSTDYLLGITKNRKQKSISGNIDNDISEIASTLFSFDENEHLNISIVYRHISPEIVFFLYIPTKKEYTCLTYIFSISYIIVIVFET